MIRLRKKADEQDQNEINVDLSGNEKLARDEATQESESKPGSVKLLGIGGRRTKKIGKNHQKKTPGEIRIQKDIAELDGGSVAQISFPDPNNLCEFNVLVTPDSGFWKGASYEFSFHVPGHYPHDPPKVLCHTKIYHPNINLQGKVCLNILREDWKPVLDINSIIYGLIYLFYEPNPEDPLNQEAAELYRRNSAEFQRAVKRSLLGGTVNGEKFPKLI
eukprot:CAMPEP_0171461518 /NCGR_PEP_ID=MMETSP0945-20130129/5933_1 /TAXON_ID=109269 /ORGANISM="Vaucheria litorea, Strain CCMP2940" /LENGTH=217 /DNA_ID=CAMNT_0011987879 /DNA_START=101 /DNA_END=754 /DNA_ORIENTATION=+